MTRVCLVGTDDVNLRYELLSRETAREALATYDLDEPFENAIDVETVSLGAAVALLNDLDWYLVRFVEEAMVLEPSVSEDEWLSRDLATAIRDDEISAADSGHFLKIYGLEAPGGENEQDENRAVQSDGALPDAESSSAAAGTGSVARYRLVEPMYVTRIGEELPTYDLREVSRTLTERVTEPEFGA